MKRLKRQVTRIISVVLTVLMILSLVPAGMIFANAATNYYWKVNSNYISESNFNYVSSFEDAWNNAKNYDNGAVGTLADVTLSSTLSTAKNKKLTLELNGHIINRGRITSSVETDYNAITVSEGSTLAVYGGTKSVPEPSCTKTFTYYNSNGSAQSGSVTNKGLITGGRNAHNGGGIAVDKNGQLDLNYTAVSGNRADDSGTTIGGFGGGIALRGDYAKLNMYNSEVSYNYAEVGGGICARDAKYAAITMENSKVNNNTATVEGGGISNSGNSENFKIKGDADADTTDKSIIHYNTCSGKGGGIYFKCENSVASGLYIHDNQAGTDAGGVYLPKEKCIIKNCRIVSNDANGGKGGGIYNDNDNNTIADTTVYNNNASGNGDGIFNYGLGNIVMSGKCVVKENDKQNLYLDCDLGQDEHYIDNSLSKGSEVYVSYSSNHPDKLTKKTGTYDDSFFYSDTSGYYFKWFPRDSTGDYNDRNIYRVTGTKPSKASPVIVSQRISATDKTYQGESVKKGIFEFPASVDDTIDREAVFYYSDGYFKDSAKTYNTHLASLSANMVMAAMYSSVGGSGSNSAEYRDKSNNIRQMMSDIGCKDEDIYVNDFNVRRPTSKTIGVCISSKDLPDGEKLVIVGVRGGGYEAEWASNVSIGSSGEANGFRDAANTVFSELKNYMSRRNINGADSKTKYWLAGYSRAGATANLTAKRIVDSFDTSGTRTFAYPIEAPKGALKSEATLANASGKYRCIHNVLNFCDLVPWVAPAGMGFTRYGVDHYVPGASSSGTPYSTSYATVADNSVWNVGESNYQSQKAKMLSQLAAMNDDIVYDDYFHMASIDYVKGVFTDNFINESDKSHSGSTNMSVENWIPKFWSALQGWGFDYNNNASTTSGSKPDKQVTVDNGNTIRTNYSTTAIKGSKSFQQALAYVMELVFSMEPEKKEQLMSCTDGIIDRIGTTELLSIYTNFINKSFSGMIGSSDFDETVENIWKALTELSTEDEAKGYHSLKEYLSADELEELHSALPALVYPILEFIANDYESYNQDHAGTLAYNAMRLIQNHYPEVAAAWVRSYDSYYDNDTTPVKLAETAGGKEAPHYPAVEVKKHGTGAVTKYETTSSEIRVGMLDEVRLVPNNSDYKNKGEGIYYCYPNAKSEDCRGWHGFSDPIVFNDLNAENYSTTGAANNKFKIDTFSAHYDRAANGTKTSGKTSAFDATKRTYSFNVVKTYEDGKYYAALQNVTKTGNMRTDIVNIAKSQNGYLEGNSNDDLSGENTNGSNNYTEYGRWYGLQDMWCAMFVSWCANQAGVSTSVIPKTASTVTALNYFIKQGTAHTRASIAAGNYTPQAGDIIFFKSGRNSAITNHIGIVTSYSGTTINTIEGNTSSATISTNGGCVRAKSYSITNTYIVYVCRPNYPTDSVSSNNVEFDGTKYDYRSWPNADTRWGDKKIGSGSATVGTSSGITTAVVKLSIQAGLHTASGFPVDNFVNIMNNNNGYTAAGAMYWDVAKTSAGFSGVDANLMQELDEGVSFESQKQQIINWILEGKHLALYVADSKGAKSWVAVDEAMTLSTGEIYIMDATTKLSENADVKVADKYVNLRRVAGFTGGQIAYELIGSDDYRTWRKADERWKDKALGDYKVYAENDQGKGDLIIASTKLAIQAGLKNPQLYNVTHAIDDTKKGSNGGFSDAGNMYWADAAQALGFDGYNANLKASGTYSSSGSYDEIKNYINGGKHLVIFVNNTWVAVDEGRTLERGEVWVWRSNIDAETGGQLSGQNICTLASIADSFTRVACFTGGKIKTSQDQHIYLPGEFNGWKTDRPMTKRSDGKYEKTIYLPQGKYEFKIIDDGYWHGNEGTIEDTTTTSSSIGWEFKGEDYGGNKNCTLKTTGGYYTFIYAAGGYSENPYHLVVLYSTTPPQQGEVAPVIDSGTEDYRKWNITDTRWANASLNKDNTAVMSNSAAGYGDLYVAGAKMMIAAGKATPETIDPGKLAAKTRVNSNTGVFDWADFASASGLTLVNSSLMSNGTYQTGDKWPAIRDYIRNNHYHLMIKIDDFSGGYGWAIVDEAMTASSSSNGIYVWLSKSTNSKSTNDNPVLLSSISETFKRVAAYSGGNSLVQTTFSGDNDSEVTAEYTYNGISAEINSGDYIPYGSAVTVKGKPAVGYDYKEWTHNLGSGDANPSSTSDSLKFTANTDSVITYKTESKNGTINYSDESHFTYAAGKPESAASGASVSFTINPEVDYIASVFVEKSNGDSVEVTKSSNTYTFTMPGGDVNVSVEMNYEDYRTWSKSDARWANTKLGSSSYTVSGTTAGMGDLVVAVTKLSKQSGSTVTDVNDAVSKLNEGGGLGTTGYLDWAGTIASDMGFNAYHLYNTTGSSTGKASDIVNGINEGKHYVIKVNNTVGWVAVDEALTKLTGEIYVMCSGNNPDENVDVRLADISSTFSNYAHFTGGNTPSPVERTVTFSGSAHIAVSASYLIGNKSYNISNNGKIYDGMTVRFKANAEPNYEFGDWSCIGVEPDDKDTAELVATATADINVTCTEITKESMESNVPLRIKYCYKDYDPMLSDTFEYQSGNNYLSEKTVYSKDEYTISADSLKDNATLSQKVLAGMPKLNSDYFNYSRTIGAGDDFTSATEYDYAVDAYVVSVDMDSAVRKYTVKVNNNEVSKHHFQELITLNASDYGVGGAVWVNNGNIVEVGDTYKLTVTGDINLTVRAKTSEDPDSIAGKSIIVPAFKTITTKDGVEKCNQNFYIQNHIDVNDSSKTLVGAGVFYYVQDDINNKPVKTAITKNNALSHLEDYALGLKSKKTGKGTKYLYNNKDTGLAYSYHNYSQDKELNRNERMLRNPGGTDYIHYLLELSMDNQPSDVDKYSYRVYSFYLYSENDETYAVISDPYAEAKVYSASE